MRLVRNVFIGKCDDLNMILLFHHFVHLFYQHLYCIGQQIGTYNVIMSNHTDYFIGSKFIKCTKHMLKSIIWQ